MVGEECSSASALTRAEMVEFEAVQNKNMNPDMEPLAVHRLDLKHILMSLAGHDIISMLMTSVPFGSNRLSF